MKKFVFAALASVFVLSSGFVSNDEMLIEDSVPCNYSITRTTPGPNYTLVQETHHFFGTADSAIACEGRINMHITRLYMGLTPW